MAKFCGNCGAPANDNDRLCGNCGAPLPNVPAAPAAAPTAANTYAPGGNPQPYGVPNDGAQPNVPTYGNPAGGDILGGNVYKPPMDPAKKKKILTFGIIGVLAAVIIVVGSILLAGSTGYKGAIKKYFKAINSQNYKKYSAVALDPMGEDDFEYDLCEDIQKVKYKIISKKKLDKSDLEDLNEWLEDKDLGTAKKGFDVKIKINYRNSSGEKDHDVIHLSVVKVGAKWKIIEEF